MDQSIPEIELSGVATDSDEVVSKGRLVQKDANSAFKGWGLREIDESLGSSKLNCRFLFRPERGEDSVVVIDVNHQVIQEPVLALGRAPGPSG